MSDSYKFAPPIAPAMAERIAIITCMILFHVFLLTLIISYLIIIQWPAKIVYQV